MRRKVSSRASSRRKGVSSASDRNSQMRPRETGGRDGLGWLSRDSVFTEAIEHSAGFAEILGGLEIMEDAVAQAGVALLERGDILAHWVLDFRAAILRIEFAE